MLFSAFLRCFDYQVDADHNVLLIYCKILLTSYHISSGSRNFKTGVGGWGRGLGEVEFLSLGFVLMPLHTYRMCL